MVIETLTEWSVSQDPNPNQNTIEVEAWLISRLPTGFTGIENKGVGKLGQRKGSRCAHINTFYQHKWKVQTNTIRRTQQGLADGWIVKIDGMTLILSFINRKQNPNYPIQSLEELVKIMTI
jgi:hypothetical protein